jgi:hypothetical protein
MGRRPDPPAGLIVVAVLFTALIVNLVVVSGYVLAR